MSFDGWMLSQEIEDKLLSQFRAAEETQPSVKYVESHIGTLTHWGYFATSELVGDVASAASLAKLLQEVIDEHYEERLTYYDARIGPKYFDEAPDDEELREQFYSFWKYKYGTVARRRWPANSAQFPLESSGQAGAQQPMSTDEIREREKIYNRWRWVRIAVPLLLFVLLFAAIFGGRNWISDSGHQQVVDRLDRIIELQLMERDGTHRHLETEHALRHLEDAIERLAETQTKDQERQNNQLPDYLVESSGQEKIVRIPQYD